MNIFIAIVYFILSITLLLLIPFTNMMEKYAKDTPSRTNLSTIKFSSFKSYYSLNPNAWRLGSTVVGRCQYQNASDHIPDCFDYIYFKFNWFDTIKYYFWQCNTGRKNYFKKNKRYSK